VKIYKIGFFKLENIGIIDIANYWNSLSFLFKDPIKPIFDNNIKTLTIDAVDKLLIIYRSLLERESQVVVQKFTLQLLVCLFASDTHLFPSNDFFFKLVKECKELESNYDLFLSLFKQMNNKTKAKGGRFKDVTYFNGGIFKDIQIIELTLDELKMLEEIAQYQWSKIDPTIFGSIFEYSMDKKTQHDTGSHYTYEQDIMKIIRPTIIEPIMEKINKANTIKSLKELRDSLGKLKILDPACGSGNFLYIALRELKNLELEIISKIQTLSKIDQSEYDEHGNVIKYSVIKTTQFFGIDINPFAVELAKVTLSFGKKIFNDLFFSYNRGNISFINKTLPFDDLDSNIIVDDALFCDWVKADIIIGNPPFLGRNNIRKSLGGEYVKKLQTLSPKLADFCTFWFRKAHEHSAKRIGLVGTNSISQGQSRENSLAYILGNKGIIVNAISSQNWNGSAGVQVSIVNWVKGCKVKDCFLDDKKVKTINSSLKNATDYSFAKPLKGNIDKSFESCELGNKGFIVSSLKAREWINIDQKYKKILKPMIDGSHLVNRNKKLNWVIDFCDMPLEEVSTYDLIFEYLKINIKHIRDKSIERNRRIYWWRFGRIRLRMRKNLNNLNFYFCLPKVAKYTYFQLIDINILPCEANMVITSDDFFILGILNSKLHIDWVKIQGSTLRDTNRYTNTTCFLTFPFPDISDEKKQEVRKIMTELENYRMKEMISRNWSITKLYNEFINEPVSLLFQLHQKLDKAVCKCYGFKHGKKNYNDEIFELNQIRFKGENKK